MYRYKLYVLNLKDPFDLKTFFQCSARGRKLAITKSHAGICYSAAVFPMSLTRNDFLVPYVDVYFI